MSDTKRSPENQTFLETSFLQGANAAYLEQMAALYARSPGELPAEWRSFFEAMGDQAADLGMSARGPSWKRTDWPPRPMAI